MLKSKDRWYDDSITRMFIVELGIILMVGAIFFINKYNIWAMVPNCFYKEKLGIFCPFCGGTRCIASLADLNFVDSFRYHPTTFIYVIFLAFSNLIYIIQTLLHSRSNIDMSFIVKSVFVYIGLTIVVYFIRIYMLFNNIDSFFYIGLF